MSSPQFGIVPSKFATAAVGFVAGSSTYAKLLGDVYPETAEGSYSPRLYGGAAVLDIVASSTDAAAKDFLLYTGLVLTTQSGGATGAMATTATTITRASGDFAADGWKVGDTVAVFEPANAISAAGNIGCVGVISAVAALTLTFTVHANSPAWAVAALVTGARVCKMSQRMRFTVAINAGNTNAIANVAVLGNAMDSGLNRLDIKLAANEIIALAPVAALSALPASVNFRANLGLY